MRLTDGNLIDMANKAAPHQDRDNDMFYIAMGRLVEEHYINANHGEPVTPIVIEVKDSCIYLLSGPLDPGQYKLYTHADPGGVERLTRKAANADLALAAQTKQVHNLRGQLATCNDARETLAAQLRAAHAQLAERDALLREVLAGLWPSTPIAIKINATLSASAEPSAPAVHPVNMKTIMQAYEQVDHKTLLHGTSNWCAAMATALRGVLCAESSAPKEI